MYYHHTVIARSASDEAIHNCTGYSGLLRFTRKVGEEEEAAYDFQT